MKSKSHFSLRRVAILSLILTFVLVGVVLAAPITLDTFDEAAQSLTIGVVGSTSGTADDASILGGERDILINNTSGGGAVTALVDNGGNNRFSLSQASGVTGNAVLVWDGNDNDATTVAPTGLGGVDLTDGATNDGFLFTIVSNDLAATMLLRVYSSATSYSDRTISLPGNILTGHRVDMFFPFSSFSLGSGATTAANFTNVGAVELRVNSGSVADLDVSIDLLETGTVRELGDLPDTYNVVLVADNGGRHVPQGLRLGTNLDAEDDGAESTDADGDDGIDAPDDEDGVVRPPVPWFTGTGGGSVDVTVQGCPVALCRLNGWIDWNNDDDFADTGEQIFTNESVGTGVNSLAFDVPLSVTFPNTFYARFRVCQTTTGGTSCNSLTGSTINGEVEDYLWSFLPSAVALDSTSTNLADSGGPVLAGLAIGGLLIATGVVITRRKRSL